MLIMRSMEIKANTITVRQCNEIKFGHAHCCAVSVKIYIYIYIDFLFSMAFLREN